MNGISDDIVIEAAIDYGTYAMTMSDNISADLLNLRYRHRHSQNQMLVCS